ncbi:facilitated trehalose transporter Tret1 isoform X2 [Episyrphus balteatus]|uniref:facilitated trehalose transporter Tret1 isoform X2 n=1 Tax=Episyrphus balteatus TaxID=286459 RepID=UPI00248634BE|nr:facilitated trehalose transporter Tret1 isoform X2 [Episyrphus balteatus]
MATRQRKNCVGQMEPKERPLFMQNGNHRNSIDGGDDEIKEFRRALPQFLAVSVKNTLLFVYGMTLGFPTIVIPAIQGGDGREPSDIVLNRDQISWFSSINLICVPLGCLFSGVFSQPIGKRKAMQIVNLPILGSWLLFHFATSTEHLYAALCLAGIGGGLMEAPVLTYVAEITEPKYRGILSVLGSTCVMGGVFVQFILGSFLDWRTIAAINTVFPVISIVCLFFIPESPTWLIRKQKFKEAIRALQWLRGWVPEYKIETEFNQLYEQLITKPAIEDANDGITDTNKRTCYQRMKIFRKQTFWFPFILVSFTFFVGHFSGKTPLQTYAVQIFHTLKAPINKFHATILLGVAEMISTILSVCLVHFTGKRPLVLISTIGCGLCFFSTGTYAYFLNVIPGFAIDNVVVNASSLVPKDHLITLDNITNIFEQNPILGTNLDKTNIADYDITTRMPELFDTTLHPSIAHLVEEPSVRVKRSNDSFDMETAEFNPFDSLPIFDYGDVNDTTEIYHQSENIKQEITTEPIPIKEAATSSNNWDKDIPSKNQVASDILLPIPKQDKNNLVWIPLILMLGAAFFAHLGIRMIPWILIGEVFPASVRSTASGLVSAVGYIFGFLANKLFIQMLASMGLPGTFWFYSFVAIGGATVLFFVLPETENKTLAEIESYFSKKTKRGRKTSIPYDHSKPPFLSDVENMNGLKVPVDVAVQKTIQLQQSDLIMSHSVERPAGRPNPGYDDTEEKNNTTHL